MGRLTSVIIVLVLAAGGSGPEWAATDLAPPFAVTAGGRIIDVPLDAEGRPHHYNYFPWVADFDGDGKPDLLVGQSIYIGRDGKDAGRLRVYANIGEAGHPRFGDPFWFDDKNPTGRIRGG